jgi:putative mRNA 3-end processing factor
LIANILSLIQFTDHGLYCAPGDFYIDPWRGVPRAVITHGHSDHARWGSKAYLCHTLTKPILQLRLGADNHYDTVDWNDSVNMNGVKVSLHPAGHIIGSSMVRVAYKGEVWLVTGDYKLEDDGLSGAWEPVQCHTLITECTFGLPIYQWQPQEQVYNDIRQWIQKNREAGKNSVLIAYSLGKAQRLLQAVAPLELPIYVHGAIWNTHEALVHAGVKLPYVIRLTQETPKTDLKKAIIIAPPGADGTPWMRKLQPYSLGVCSGWMQVRGNARRSNADRGFVLSDHADWPSLLKAIESCGAQKVFTTHGFTASFSRYLNEQGIDSEEVKTEYGTEDAEN